jgi:plasmid stabilization system protein ParE
MEIIWLPLAEEALEHIYYFYAEYSNETAKKIVSNIRKEVELLALSPK